MSSTPHDMHAVVWPRGNKAVTVQPVARRLESLAGKTIGQLWDRVVRGDEIFPVFEESLTRLFPGVKFVH